jgi:hypothetical protein
VNTPQAAPFDSSVRSDFVSKARTSFLAAREFAPEAGLIDPITQLSIIYSQCLFLADVCGEIAEAMEIAKQAVLSIQPKSEHSGRIKLLIEQLLREWAQLSN